MRIKPSYKGRHAELYDIFYGKKDYAAEAGFVHRCIKKFSRKPVKKLLELASGTGNHAAHLSAYGYHILATDNSPGMLKVASSKLKTHPNIKIAKMDMLHFNRFGSSFDAIVCLFDSIGYVQSNQNVKKVIENVQNCLGSSGLFVFEYWNAGAMLRNYAPVRIRKWNRKGHRITRVSRTVLDYENQICRVSYSIREQKSGIGVTNISETQVNRFFLPQEMNHFLEEAGFKVLALYDGYSTRSIDENSWHTVCVAVKK